MAIDSGRMRGKDFVILTTSTRKANEKLMKIAADRIISLNRREAMRSLSIALGKNRMSVIGGHCAMPLAFDDRGILANGIHDATFDEVKEAFGRFQRTDRRHRLIAKLQAYLQNLQRAGIDARLILDGSFVMAGVDEPDDIDAVLILPRDWDLNATLRPIQYNLLSRRHTKTEYNIEVFPVVAGSEHEEYWLAFFAQVNVKWSQHFGWPTGLRKGLVRLSP